MGVRRATADRRARWPRAVAGPAPLLLEVREVDQPARADSGGPPRVLGAATATTTAGTRGSSSATRAIRDHGRVLRRGGHGCDGVDDRTDHLQGLPRPAPRAAPHARRGPPTPLARTALPHPVACPRRLHGPAVVLRRLRRQRPARGVPRRAAPRRGGLGVPRRRGRGRRRPRDARPDRALVQVGHLHAGGVPGRWHRRRPGGRHAAGGPAPRPSRPAPGDGGRAQPRRAAVRRGARAGGRRDHLHPSSHE